ncbi:BON domain-containing protein [Nonomuraea sp. NPDC049129]|uniref:BON domain-containing protein n=1 Tax=Nonomuraea sp. NPDC049129 TaxID=3155272 RepID=UPI0033E9DFF0
METSGVAVHVDRGVVTLSGWMDRRGETMLATRMAHRVNGVVDIIDKLTVGELLAGSGRSGGPLDAPAGGLHRGDDDEVVGAACPRRQPQAFQPGDLCRIVGYTSQPHDGDRPARALH